MTKTQSKQLGNVLWDIANQLRGAMNADDFRDYMLSFLFHRYLSDNYEAAAKKELGCDYPHSEQKNQSTPLKTWYSNVGQEDQQMFEGQMRRKTHYVIHPDYLWSAITELARTQNADLLLTLQKSFKYIENESFASTFQGLFSEINLDSEKLGRKYEGRNRKLCTIITKIAEGVSEFSAESDILGDAYEYLIGKFAAGSGKKAGEFYTPQEVSSVLSRIVTLDSQVPDSGTRKKLDKVLDFSCGSGSLLLNIRNRLDAQSIGRLCGQEKNITTFNLARMNMLLHGLKDTEFDIYHGDSLANDWPILSEMNPSKKLTFDAVVANPPFSYTWDPNDTVSEDFRFKNYALAPKSSADFAFLLHGFHFLDENGTMAIILPHGALFRSGSELSIRTKLLTDGHIDTVIGLPAKLFFSTGISVCVLVLKKCKKPDDVLFINASEHFEKDGRLNRLRPEDIEKIVDAYQYRKQEERYSRRVSMEEIKENDYNLNLSRYVTTMEPEPDIDVLAVAKSIKEVDKRIQRVQKNHNQYTEELGLPRI